MNKTEFEKDLEIDVENLDVEAALHSELYFKYAKLVIKAKKHADLAKMNLEIIEAELAQRARLKPRLFGIKNVTNPSIKEAVVIHPEYKIARIRMIKAQYIAGVIAKAENSMEHRKRSLEMLIQLHGREYFAGPKVPYTSKQFYKRVKEKKGEKTHENMIKKSRKRKRKKI